VTVPPSIGSGRGIETVGNGEYVLGRVARLLKEKEAQYGLTYTVFAKDAVVFCAGRDVTVDGLTSQQLIDMYSGTITNWEQVGGRSAPVRVLTREEGDSSLSVIRKYIPEFKTLTVTDRAKTVYHDYEMVEVLTSFPTSIGFGTRSSMPTEVQVLAVNQLSPTHDNVMSGVYPMVGDYAFIYKEQHLNQAARDFMDFVFSSKGREILLVNGLVDVNVR
jgi:phosphate transport system substrate-binding protein